MDMSHLKTQITTMMMMKSANNGQNNGMNDMFPIIYSIIVMNLIDVVFRYIPVFSDLVKKYIENKWIQTKSSVIVPSLLKSESKKEQINSVTMIRVYDNEKSSDKTDNIYSEKTDAILDYMCNLDNVKHIRMDVRCLINTMDEIELTPLVRAKIKQSSLDSSSSIELMIYSNKLKISEIRNWIDEIHENYVSEKNNKIGNKNYYFNEIPNEPLVITDMSNPDKTKKIYRWDNMPKYLSFHMNEFKTSKSFSNVYGNHVNELKDRLDLFLHHPEWYMERGIPHSLGIMMHGIPGAGKTSTIKAIAKDTNRHIFNLSLRAYTSQRQLTNLFYNETTHIVSHDGGKQTLKIPLNRRVYVIEDIDCLTNVVFDRNLLSNNDNESEIDANNDAVNLSFLLNLLDGVLETPGRILIITSNYPEKLDKAFVRPGRIDVKIEFKHTSREFILDMINKFYSISLKLEDIPKELESVFTPAEVMESFCNNFKNYSAALKQLVSRHAMLETQKSGTFLSDLGIIPTNTSITEQTEQTEERKIEQTEERKIEQTEERKIEQIEQTKQRKIEQTEPPQLSIREPFVNRLEPILKDTKVLARTSTQQQNDTSKPNEFFGFSLMQPGNTWSSAIFNDDIMPEGAGGWIPGRDADPSSVSKVNLNESHF